MGPFTNRQTAYIRAIAGKSSHKSFIVKNVNTKISNSYTAIQTPQNWQLADAGMTIANWNLNICPQGLDSRSMNVNQNIDDLEPVNTWHGFGVPHDLALLQCPIDTSAGGTQLAIGNDHVHNSATPISSTEFRIGDQAFLESTHLQFRFVMPGHVGVNAPTGQVHSMDTPHYEWRFIIFRNKRPTYRHHTSTTARQSISSVRDGVSLANPGYDLFMGQAGRPRGPCGWRTHHEFDKNLNLDDANLDTSIVKQHNGVYAGKYWNGTAWVDGEIPDLTPPGEDLMTVDDYLTMRLNRNDYVIHTDERFFLGQQFGKSHYEKTVHFDWKDFIDTTHDDLTTSPTLDGKNYEWTFLLIGSSNTTNNPAELDVKIRATTCLTSGQ